jgi:tRNA(fMet)-specific endonuclease VapC
MKRVLIDTNIYSYAMESDTETTNLMRRIDVIGFATISIGELLAGFKGESQEEENRDQLNTLRGPKEIGHKKRRISYATFDPF